MQKKVLITGGNKGIGLETAKIFLKMDYDIFVVARDFSNFELGGLPNVTEIEADLSDLSILIQSLTRVYKNNGGDTKK